MTLALVLTPTRALVRCLTSQAGVAIDHLTHLKFISKSFPMHGKAALCALSLAHSQNHLSTHTLDHSLTHSPTHFITYLRIHLFTYLLMTHTHSLTHSSTCLVTYLLTYTHSATR